MLPLVYVTETHIGSWLRIHHQMKLPNLLAVSVELNLSSITETSCFKRSVYSITLS